MAKTSAKTKGAKSKGKRKGAAGTTSTGKATRARGAKKSGKKKAAKKKAATAKKAVGARTRKGKPSRKAAAKTSTRKAAVKKAPARKAARPAQPAPRPRAASARRGGSGREETLAQTPATGRTRRGPTNPMPTKRSTGTPAGAGTSRSPNLNRSRKTLREVEEGVPTPPSSLDLDRGPSAARSGRQKLQETQDDHNETSPVMTSGDVDADWEDAYSVGDEAPGGDNPTPDQDRVDDIGKALGVTYDDNEELKASDKIADRDKHRWELDPASSEDYRDRD